MTYQTMPILDIDRRCQVVALPNSGRPAAGLELQPVLCYGARGSEGWLLESSSCFGKGEVELIAKGNKTSHHLAATRRVRR